MRMKIDEHNTKILLVSDNKDDIGKIKLRLEEAINFPCHIWHCLMLCETLDYLNKRKSPDIIILDLPLIGTINPKEIYEKIEEVAQKIPIIVLTGVGKEEHDLATFAMQSGACDHMIRGKFNRLLDAIEFSLIRHKVTIQATEAAKNQPSPAQKIIQDAHDEKMKNAQKESDEKNERKNQCISWMMGGYSVEGNQEDILK